MATSEYADELEQVAEKLSDALLRAEDVITGLNLGVSAEVPLHLKMRRGERVIVYDKSHTLVFSQREGDWCLSVRGKDGVHHDLFEADLELRSEAARNIPLLIQALYQERDDAILWEKMGGDKIVARLEAFNTRIRQLPADDEQALTNLLEEYKNGTT